jgi:glyoxylase-like metal-dependent hydrolase (beta-lactamase superfamily II)
MKPLSWKIGKVTVTQIIEMEENKIFSSFIPKAIPEEIKKIEWLYPYFVDENGNLKALVQSFLIKSKDKNILIDTCNGNGKNRPNVPEWGNLNTDYLERFNEVGISPNSIDFVLCTHFHFDHVGWNTKMEDGKWVPTFPNARYLFSKEEYEYWIKRPEKEMIDDLNGLDDSITPIVDAGLANFVSDDYQIDRNIRLISTPGHTPHHVSVVIESQGKKAIISGDFVHHPCQIAHEDWTSAADTYPEQTVETRKKLLAEIKNTDTLLIGCHFANPVAGKVVESQGNLIFVPLLRNVDTK